MEILSPATRIDAGLHQTVPAADAELARLRAQVAWLQAEREALWWAVGHDELTGLANRRGFYMLAPTVLREPGRPAVVIVLDLNGFKPINDRFGHDAGDRVLCVVAKRLARHVGDNLAARLGGDEFAAVVSSPYPYHREQWWQPAVTALSAAIAEPVSVGDHSVTVTASIGVAPARGDAEICELLHDADLAMYQAKMSGSSHVVCGVDTAIGAGHSRQVAAVPAKPTTQGHIPAQRSQVLELAIISAAQQKGAALPAPTCDPVRRDPVEVAPAGTYHPRDPVWVHRYGAWRPGVVEDASSRAVMITYRCAQGQGTVVDTVSAEFVLPRIEADPQLDRTTSGPGTAA
ncbi:GGDEF domain-containing protein [Planosporangium mesophilum]|uniref:GGDEF domain-containing protein n=1 Tax=Planosporangium mesophilum TaxID=689768 RepID=A0A8J3TGN1_9ACTN|nr:GGDEF domain-containing protein [Planosporangium mesophilum]NJC85729.1 GGDEF domain-containing protein [Planosporangium mesophilum]GII24807.1 hypothetical protein Pme01_44040 [Planosporangium mesophilum]